MTVPKVRSFLNDKTFLDVMATHKCGGMSQPSEVCTSLLLFPRNDLVKQMCVRHYAQY